MSPDSFSIVSLKSGCRSVRSHRFNETFHPVVGPMIEARNLHAAQQNVAERASAHPFVVYDIGLGAAANAIAIIESLLEARLDADLHSFDRDNSALRFALAHADDLGYILPHAAALEALAATGRHVLNSGPENSIRWTLHLGDFPAIIPRLPLPPPNAILFDPYSPATNPDMWTVETFQKIHSRLDPSIGCLLTNYTRSTAVRVTLLLAGFYVGRGAATGEKDETTLAANQLPLLKRPLDRDWLAAAHRSTRSAPLRSGIDSPGKINPADYAALLLHPQFS